MEQKTTYERECLKCKKAYTTTYASALLCKLCYWEGKSAGTAGEPQTVVKEERIVDNRMEMIRMSAVKNALHLLELEISTQQRKEVSKADMYALASEMVDYTTVGKKGV